MKTTEKLEHKIKNKEEFKEDYINPKILLKEEISKSNYSISSINSALGLNNYLYEILDLKNTKKYSRDTILSILIYIESDIDTIQQILQGFSHSKLYVRVPRDCIIFKGICDNLHLFDIENNLVIEGFDPLFKR